MSEPAVRAELQLTFKDGATAGLKSVTQSAEAAANKTASASVEAANKSVSAVQAQHDAHIKAYKSIATARETLGVRSERVIRDEIKRTQSAYETLARSGEASARELARAQDANIAKVRALRMEMGELTKMQKLQSVGKKYMPLAGGMAAGGAVGYGVMRAFVNKSAEQEMAFTELRISMTDKNNKVSGNYGKALEIATDLGNKLPGNTRDFILEAQALKQMGITESVIVNGGLKAAGNLRALLEMRGEGEAGKLVGTEMHTFGLKDTDMEAAADTTYRMHKAYGMTASEIQYANQYDGGDLNMLGWTGLENMKKVQAIQGMMKMKGVDSSVFGTHFADMIKFAAQNKTRLEGKGALTREANEVLDKHHIKLNFFDKQEKFVSPDKFVKELEKLQKLTQKEQIEVFHKLFGLGSDVAVQIVKAGTKGFQEAQEKRDNTLDSKEAIKQKGDTFEWKREALSGSADNLMAAMGDPIKDDLKPVLDVLNDFAGTATTFFQKNPLSATLVTVSAAATASVAAAGLFSMFVRGGVGLPVRVVNSGAHVPEIDKSGKPKLDKNGKPVSTKSSRMMGKTALLAATGGAGLSLYDDKVNAEGGESTLAHYGGAALQGASLGALAGPWGAVAGAVGGILVQGVMDALKPHEPKPSESHVRLDVNLPPGATVKSQNMQSLGHTKVFMNTGNLWHGGVPG